MDAGGGIPLPPPNLRQAADRMTEIDLCPIERMECALDREDQAAMGVKCHVPRVDRFQVPSESVAARATKSDANMTQCRTKLLSKCLVALTP